MVDTAGRGQGLGSSEGSTTTEKSESVDWVTVKRRRKKPGQYLKNDLFWTKEYSNNLTAKNIGQRNILINLSGEIDHE